MPVSTECAAALLSFRYNSFYFLRGNKVWAGLAGKGGQRG